MAAALLVLVSGGCRRSPAMPELGPGEVAVWQGGRISVDELDALVRAGGGRGDVSPSGLRTLLIREVELRVREAAGELALAERDPAFAERADRIIRERLATLWLRSRNARFDVLPEEIEARFERDRSRWARPERREFRHLLVAPATGEAPELTCRRAGELAERVRAGESFEALAREHSASTSRHNGGLVAAVARRGLREPLAGLIFGLEPGVVSDPVATPAGCQIFQVVTIQPAIEPDVRLLAPEISKEIAAERRREWMRGLLRVELERHGLDGDALEGVSEQTPVDTLLLEVGDLELTAGRVLEERQRDEVVTDAALRLAGTMVLPLSARVDDAAAAEHVASAARRELAFELARQEALRTLLAQRDPAEIERFFEDNRNRFATEPEVELTLAVWDIPAGVDPLTVQERALAQLPQLAARNDQQLVDEGVELVAIPGQELRLLTLRAPQLALLAYEELAEGKVVGPWHAGRRLYAARVEGYTAARPRSLVEAEGEVRAAWVNEHRDELEAQLERELFERYAVVVASEEQLAALGRQLVESLAGRKE
jgi:hypothetical protein